MMTNSSILIVDDEPLLCSSIKALLSSQSYKVETCSRGDEALDLLTQDKFDLVLIDIVMEGMDGFQVIESIMKQKIDIPVIVMTGNYSTESAIRALRAGANDYLKKPFEPEELFVSVRNILDRKILKEKLKESEKKYRLLVENQTDMVVKIDTEGRFLFVSPSFSEMFNKKGKELLDTKFMNMVHEKDRASVENAMAAVLLPPYTAYMEQRSLDNGDWKWFSWMGTAVLDEKQNVEAVIGVGRDVSKQKHAERGRERLVVSLREALENVKTLSGLVPICANCKQIRDDEGYWNQIEAHIEKHSYASFSHGICPVCSDELYGGEDWYIEMKKKNKK